MLLLTPFGSTTNSFVLPGILPVHFDLVSGTLSTLPEAPARLSNDTPTANVAVFRSVVLFSAAPATDHPITVFVRVVFFFIVTPIAWINATTAAEPEPSV